MTENIQSEKAENSEESATYFVGDGHGVADTEDN